MSILNYLIVHAIQFPALFIFIAALILSEEATLFMAILSGHGLFPIWKVALFGLIGIFIVDLTVFLVARSRLVNFFRGFIKRHHFYKKTSSFAERISHSNKFAHLTYSKFFWGIRWLSIAKISRSGMKFGKFFIVDLAACATWTIIAVPIGWFIGNRFANAFNIVNDFGKMVIFAVVVVFLLYIFEGAIRKILDTIARHAVKHASRIVDA